MIHIRSYGFLAGVVDAFGIFIDFLTLCRDDHGPHDKP